MAHIEWNGRHLGEVQGNIVFTSGHPAPAGKPIELPREIAISVSFLIPDDSSIYKWPIVQAANAPNN